MILRDSTQDFLLKKYIIIHAPVTNPMHIGFTHKCSIEILLVEDPQQFDTNAFIFPLYFASYMELISLTIV